MFEIKFLCISLLYIFCISLGIPSGLLFLKGRKKLANAVFLLVVILVIIAAICEINVAENFQ